VGPAFEVAFSSMRGVRSIFGECDCKLCLCNRSDNPLGLPLLFNPGDFGSSPAYAQDTDLRREASAGDGEALRRAFAVALIRFFPCYNTRRQRGPKAVPIACLLCTLHTESAIPGP
jgi:hypothetical protein